MLKFMRKVPGGMLIVPMVLAIIFNTLFPNALNIKGMTEASFTPKATQAIIGLMTFVSGANVKISALPRVFKKIGSLMLVRALVASLIAYLYFKFFGQEGIFGIPAISIACLGCISAAIYMALSLEYGEQTDRDGFVMTGFLTNPGILILIYSLSNINNFDVMNLVSSFAPLIVGMIIGNLDKDFAKFLDPLVNLLMPFLGWTFGMNVNLGQAFSQSVNGIILTVVLYAINLPIMFVFEKNVLKSNGLASLSLVAVGAVSIAAPGLLAETDSFVKANIGIISSQLAFVALITNIVTPIFVGKFCKQNNIVRK